MNLNKITFNEELSLQAQTEQPIRAFASQANTIEVLAPVSEYNTAYIVLQGLKDEVVNPKLRATQRLYMSRLSDSGEYRRWNLVIPGAILNDMSLMNSTGVRVRVEFWYIEGDHLGVEKYNTTDTATIISNLTADYPSAIDGQFVRVIDTNTDWVYNGTTWEDYGTQKLVGISTQPTESVDFALEKGIYTDEPTHAPTNTELILQELATTLKKTGGVMTGDIDMDGNNLGNVGAITLYNAEGTAVITYNGRDVVVNYQGVEGELFKNLYVEVKADEAISNGDVLQYTGAVGASGRIRVKKAVRTEINANPHLFVGIATTDIASGNNGLINWYGAVNDLDTSSFTQGDVIYINTTDGATPGTFTATKPIAPNVQVKIGVVTLVSATQGQIKIRPEIGNSLSNLHDVHYNGHVFTDEDILVYNLANARWEVKTKAEYLSECAQLGADNVFTGDNQFTQPLQVADAILDTEAVNKGQLDAEVTDIETQLGNKADLVGGTVPASQLPSFVDDVIEVATYADLPATGESNKLYVVINDETQLGNDQSIYRWASTVYVLIHDEIDASQIKSLYESNANTNAFTDAEKTKLTDLYNKAQLDVLFDNRYTKAETDALLNQLKAIYGWQDTAIGDFINTDTLAYSAIEDYDFILATWHDTNVTPEEVFTVYFKPEHLALGRVVETQIQNSPYRSGAISHATQGTLSFVILDANNNTVTGNGFHIHVTGVKMEQQLAENIAYDTTNVKAELDANRLNDNQVKEKVAEQEKEINDLKSQLAIANANNEPLVTQEVVSKVDHLPVNAAPLPLKVNGYGRTIPALDNLVTYGDFSDGTTGWINNSLITFTVSNNEATLLSDNSNDYLRVNYPIIEGNIYYVSAYIKSTSNQIRFVNYDGVAISQIFHSGGGGYELLSIIDTAQSTTNGFLQIQDQRTSGYDNYYVKNVVSFNLTQLFGVTATSGTAYDNAVQAVEDMLEINNDYIDTTDTTHVVNPTVESVGKNLFDKTKYTTVDYAYKIKVEPSQDYVWSESVAYKTYDKDLNEVASGTATTLTMGADTYYIAFANTIADKDAFQLEQGSTATTYEAYAKQSKTYVGTFRSVGSVQDEFNDEVKVKKVGTDNVTGVVSVDTTNYPLALNGGTFTNYLTAGGSETGIIGTDSTSGDGLLHYELATPTEENILTLGDNLQGSSKAQIINSSTIADLTLYDTNAEILLTDSPITTLDYLGIMDFDTGVITDLDHTTATVAVDGLSFTHASLSNGDIVVFRYTSTRLNGQLDVTYVNNNAIIEDTTNGNYYHITFSVANGTPTLVATEVG